MPTANEHAYTVCILFNHSLSQILLVRKNRTYFINKLNGPGGAIEPGETPYDGALREIWEETGLEAYDFMPVDDKNTDSRDDRLAPIGILSIPHDCKTQDGAACVLHYFAGQIKKGSESKIRPATEPLEWMPAHMVMRSRTDSPVFAGNGDLAYFSTAGYKALLAGMPVDPEDIKSAETEPEMPFNQGLTHNINRVRGRLDTDFRDGDMYQASLDAAEISRMCYAAYCMSLHDAKTTKAEEKAENAAHQNHQNPNSPKTFSDGSVE